MSRATTYVAPRYWQVSLLPNSVSAVFPTEGAAVNWIKARIRPGTVVNADEAACWDTLNDRFEMKRIDHQDAYSLDGACTNMAEEYFSRLRRAEIGHHHRIAGAYLLRCAQESAWREDNRRVSNGAQTRTVAHLAMKRGPSVDFSGYWQQHIRRKKMVVGQFENAGSGSAAQEEK